MEGNEAVCVGDLLAAGLSRCLSRYGTIWSSRMIHTVLVLGLCFGSTSSVL